MTIRLLARLLFSFKANPQGSPGPAGFGAISDLQYEYLALFLHGISFYYTKILQPSCTLEIYFNLNPPTLSIRHSP